MKVSHTFPTHKDCRNFRNGVCILLGVPVNPDGPACPRFTARDLTPPLAQQKPLTTIAIPFSQPSKSTTSEASLAELKHRLDEAEVKLRKIKAMLNRMK